MKGVVGVANGHVSASTVVRPYYMARRGFLPPGNIGSQGHNAFLTFGG